MKLVCSSLTRLGSSCRGRSVFGFACAVMAVSWIAGSSVRAEIVINELIADNGEVGPADFGGGFPDILELYNTGEEDVVLGDPDPGKSYYLSDECESLDASECTFRTLGSWRFPSGTVIPAQGFLIVYCDGDAVEGLCELHASFELAANGSEAIALWSPRDESGARTIVSRVWLPPLDRDVSFGRFPDGAGPAIVPVAETFDHFVFNPLSETTFGSCVETEEDCRGAVPPGKLRECTGAANAAGGNLPPDIDLDSDDFSTNAPADGEPVVITAEVRDDELPLAGNIVRASILYTVDGIDQPEVPMNLVDETVHDRADDGRPLDRYTRWTGTIPGQPAGSVVEFRLTVQDVGAGSAQDPRTLCPPDTGPCNRIGFPGENCVRDPDNDLRFLSCRVPYRYRVGYEPSEALAGLLINEVVATQTSIIEDKTDDACADDNPTCKFDDYLELYNTSTEEIDLSGMWLSDRPFNPQGWPFPEGSTIAGGERLIVWLDGDGGRCPFPDEAQDGDGQDCANPPTDPASGEYHTDFRLSGSGEQVYLYASADESFGLLHGLRFGLQTENVALVLCPDGVRGGEFGVESGGSPGAENSCSTPVFVRGDSNSDCSFNLADAVFTLNALFGGGVQPTCLDAADTNDSGNVDISDPIFGLSALFLDGELPLPPGPGCPGGEDPTPDDLLGCRSSCESEEDCPAPIGG